MSIITDIKTKICNDCGESKWLTDEYWHVQRGSIDGYFDECKSCVDRKVRTNKGKSMRNFVVKNYSEQQIKIKNCRAAYQKRKKINQLIEALHITNTIVIPLSKIIYHHHIKKQYKIIDYYHYAMIPDLKNYIKKCFFMLTPEKTFVAYSDNVVHKGVVDTDYIMGTLDKRWPVETHPVMQNKFRNKTNGCNNLIRSYDLVFFKKPIKLDEIRNITDCVDMSTKAKRLYIIKTQKEYDSMMRLWMNEI